MMDEEIVGGTDGRRDGDIIDGLSEGGGREALLWGTGMNGKVGHAVLVTGLRLR